MLTQSMTPNQISAASGPTTGVSIFCAAAAIIGRMMNAYLEEIEKECQKENEKVDKCQEPPHPARQDNSMFSSHLLPSTPKRRRRSRSIRSG